MVSPGAGRPPLLLIDVRTPDEWEAARVPGAALIPLHELESRADEIDAEKDAPIGVMCHHGARSLKGALILRAMGFTNARSVVGGIDLWSLDIDPAVPRYDHSGGRCVRLPGGAR
jgi:rhodanese-related sulfurtransferase